MTSRLPARLHAIGMLVLLGVATSAMPALARPDVDGLRARIEALEGDLPAGVERGALVGVAYMLDISQRIARGFPSQSAQWRRRAGGFLDALEVGEDPYLEGRGQILNRAYEASFSPRRQGYAVYLPRDYDPRRRYPLLVMLHGGSSLGNLFLGVVLGNNMSWNAYDQHLWDDFTPRFHPDLIVVAPDGVGQVMWRWMGEQDVLEVIDDVARNYSVDEDRVMLGGLSNGGVGAYAIGARHAWRFSHVHAIAAAPCWLMYTGGRPTEEERTEMLRLSGKHLVENTVNTDFRYYHGTSDPGPMRPGFIRRYTAHIERLGLRPAPRERWYERGHDLLYVVHRHGDLYPELAEIRRDPSPAEVRLASGDYRAARQFWVGVTRFERYPRLGRVHAKAQAGRIEAEVENVLELFFDLEGAPLGAGDDLRIIVNGIEAYGGPRAPLGRRVHLSLVEGRFRRGFLPEADGLEKRPGLSGPLTDAYHDEIVHVYGTQGDAKATRTLRRTAERGARGWPSGVWTLDQLVVADTEVDEALSSRAHLALYGAPGQNAVLDRIAARLPLTVENGAVRLGERDFSGKDVGARFIHPNPESPGRYVIVQTGVSAEAVWRGRNLPDFLPDYVVYDNRATASRPRLVSGRNTQLAAGYFDRFWRLTDAGGERDAATIDQPRDARGGEEN